MSETTIDKNGKMTFRKGDEPVKKKPGRKPVYIHKCSKEVILDRMSNILVGNGHPEDGLAFRFNEFMKDHKRVVNDITEIKGKVTEAIESSGKAIHAVETYKAEINGIEIGEGKKIAKKKLKFDTVVSIIGTIVIVIGLALSTYFSLKATSVTRATVIKEVNDIGIKK